MEAEVAQTVLPASQQERTIEEDLLSVSLLSVYNEKDNSRSLHGFTARNQLEPEPDEVERDSVPLMKLGGKKKKLKKVVPRVSMKWWYSVRMLRVGRGYCTSCTCVCVT